MLLHSVLYPILDLYVPIE